MVAQRSHSPARSRVGGAFFCWSSGSQVVIANSARPAQDNRDDRVQQLSWNWCDTGSTEASFARPAPAMCSAPTTARPLALRFRLTTDSTLNFLHRFCTLHMTCARQPARGHSDIVMEVLHVSSSTNPEKNSTAVGNDHCVPVRHRFLCSELVANAGKRLDRAPIARFGIDRRIPCGGA